MSERKYLFGKMPLATFLSGTWAAAVSVAGIWALTGPLIGSIVSAVGVAFVVLLWRATAHQQAESLKSARDMETLPDRITEKVIERIISSPDARKVLREMFDRIEQAPPEQAQEVLRHETFATVPAIVESVLFQPLRPRLDERRRPMILNLPDELPQQPDDTKD